MRYLSGYANANKHWRVRSNTDIIVLLAIGVFFAIFFTPQTTGAFSIAIDAGATPTLGEEYRNPHLVKIAPLIQLFSILS